MLHCDRRHREQCGGPRDERELIGDGTDERVVVNVAMFDERVQRRLQSP